MKPVGSHLYLFASLFFAGLSQIIIRWQMSKVGEFPPIWTKKIAFAFALLLKPWIVAAVAVTAVSGLCWMVTLTKFEISYAYPWTSLLYLYMLVAGYFLFGDLMSSRKIFGTAVIIIGVYLISK
jgi:drug/metabolite transporter (DMT)-like permease